MKKYKIIVQGYGGEVTIGSVGDMLNRIYYNDEEIENWGGSTDGKSFEAYKNF